MDTKFIEVSKEIPDNYVLKPTRDSLFAGIALVNGADYQKMGIDPIEAMIILEVMNDLGLKEKDIEFLTKVYLAKNAIRVHAQVFKILLVKEGVKLYENISEDACN